MGKSDYRLSSVFIGILVVGILVVASACNDNLPEQNRDLSQTALPDPLSKQSQITPIITEGSLPALPSERAASDVILSNTGESVYALSLGATAAGGSLILDPAAGEYEYGIYQFNPGADTVSNVEIQLSLDAGDEVWIGLADYSKSTWDIRGPFPMSLSMSVNDNDLHSPAGFFYVLVLAWDGNEAEVENVVVTTDGSGGANIWPADPTHLAWLNEWYLPLPLQFSPNRVFQSEQNRDYADQVLSLVNSTRATDGLGPLVHDPHLEAIATAYCSHMAAEDFVGHHTPEGLTPGDRLETTDPPNWTWWGENMAAGQPTPAAVVQSWLDSPGHRANIMHPDYEYIGIGVHNDAESTYGIYWVQMFGSFISDPAAHDWIDTQETP